MKIRTGRKQPRNLYIQHGPTPSDSDTLCGQVDTPELARLIVASAKSMRWRITARPVSGLTQ